ncbi:MAG: prepilin-type N-terminal cleavage/methylation domain-containing protein [Planctomycetaceae bacterium]|nr:prepilin-type N-terminal cleavage/methylation domain-containing protein [Planctomycetaceae bacterium]
MTNARTNAVRRGGFTLLEMLIVIGIIALLASLVLAVSSSVIRASEERNTRNTLEVLNTAVEEYERTLDRAVSYRSAAYTGVVADPTNAGQRYDIDSAPAAPPAGSGVAAWTAMANPYNALATAGLPAYSTAPFRRTATLIWALTQSPSSAAIMQKLPDSVLRGVRPSSNTAGFLGVRHVVDSWETPIVAIFPGRVAGSNGITENANTPVDKDGTIRCDSEGAAATAGGMGVSCKDRKILFVSAGNDARFTQLTAGVYSPSSDNLYSYEP